MTASPARNVVLIVFDYMGYHDIGFGPGARTPAIDSLAASGTRFSDAYAAAPVCGPSRAALMTGCSPRRLGFETNRYPGEPGLPASVPTLPRLFARAGFRTALCGKWHLGYAPEDGPNAHGFEHFLGFNAWNIDYYSHRLEGSDEIGLLLDGAPVDRPGYTTDLFADDAIAFIARHRAERFFVYLSFNAMLPPYAPPGLEDDPGARDRWERCFGPADYRAAVRRLDDSVERVRAALARHGLLDDTLIALTYDHGGAELADRGPFSGGFADLREGGIRVPLIVALPGGVPAGAVDHRPVMLTDLAATLLTAAGISAETARDGRDLFGAAGPRDLFWRMDVADRLHRWPGWQGPVRQWAMRRGRWKFLHQDGRDFLFDLARDPAEAHDLSPREPALAAELRARAFGDWMAGAPDHVP